MNSLREAHQTALDKLEQTAQLHRIERPSTRRRVARTYLDLVEQQYWLDPVEGLRYLLPFMIMASAYQREINDKESKGIGDFFIYHLQFPYRELVGLGKGGCSIRI